MKNLEEKSFDNDELLHIVNEINKLLKEDRYNNDSNIDLKNDYPDKIIKLEEALVNYIIIWVKMILTFCKQNFPTCGNT